MREREEIREAIKTGKAVLGIELGSTRIKAVLIDEDKSPVASGSYDWEINMWTISGLMTLMKSGKACRGVTVIL